MERLGRHGRVRTAQAVQAWSASVILGETQRFCEADQRKAVRTVRDYVQADSARR